ncbi:uncharacterized protein LOC113371056 [Ctenocephalides felis]|uniref:uncharacterized protein LOC113371056 n=1 Tax=Ctenocephalides felis TaxID=7515 RepID=UPI000E6E113E|nr:uncharacterized protein LOC113371056 [Ctenocephalides felis]
MQFLNNMIVSVDGDINVPANKIFMANIVQENASLQENRKVEQIVALSNRKVMDARLRVKPTIFDGGNALSLTNVDQEYVILDDTPIDYVDDQGNVLIINGAPESTHEIQEIINVNDSDSEESCSSAKSAELQCSEDNVNAVPLTISFKVTPEIIESARVWLTALEVAYKTQNEVKKIENVQSNAMVESNYKFKIPACFYTPGENMEEISPGCGFFLPKNKIIYIEQMSKANGTENGWVNVVREVLLLVYGEQLKNFSATGMRSKRPPIDQNLFGGLVPSIEIYAGQKVIYTLRK